MMDHDKIIAVLREYAEQCEKAEPGEFQYEAYTVDGPVAVRGRGEIRDMVMAFRGFLIAQGYPSDLITTEMGREW